jgi:hypothetical protein
MEQLPSADLKTLEIRSQDAGRVHSLEHIPEDQKKGIRWILGMVVKQWPVDPSEISLANLSLVSGYSFYHEHFRPLLNGLRKLETHGKKIAQEPLASGHGFNSIWIRVRHSQIVFAKITHVYSSNTMASISSKLIGEMPSCNKSSTCLPTLLRISPTLMGAKQR